MKEKIKILFKYMLAGVIGYYVLCELVYVPIFGSLIFTKFDFSYATLKPYQLLYTIFVWGIVILGIFLGLYATKKQNLLYHVFSIKKHNLILNIIFVMLIVIIFTLMLRIKFELPLKDIHPNFVTMSQMTLLSLVYYHPFFALIHFIFIKIKHKKYSNLLVWILFAIIINPYFIYVVGNVSNSIKFAMFNRPCGVRIGDVTPQMPADEAGMKEGMIISKIDDVKTERTGELFDYVYEMESAKELTISTDKGFYKVTPVLNDSGKYKIGIRLEQEYCEE